VKYIFKTKVQSFQDVKNKLLEQINLIPNNPMQSEGQNITHTDWNLPRTMHREYANLFIKTVTPHIHVMVEELKAQEAKIDNYWFQTYGENGKHNWHTHPQTNYANVFFLECPQGYSTQFKDFSENCEEGDIISFPAFLPHCSPPIEAGSIKTVIAFNTDFICG
jgi:hypothetical protein